MADSVTYPATPAPSDPQFWNNFAQDITTILQGYQQFQTQQTIQSQPAYVQGQAIAQSGVFIILAVLVGLWIIFRK